MIAYWLAQLRPTIFAFTITAVASILVMNVSTACGCFFSAAFNSVPLAMAYLVPFDYILMITSGVFLKLSTLPEYLSWLPYFSWLMYGNEAMSIVQWEGVTNIGEFNYCKYLSQLLIHLLQLARKIIQLNCLAIKAAKRSCSVSISRRVISTSTLWLCFCFTFFSIF